MDLQFTDEQQMIREAVRGLAEQYGDPDRVRALEDSPKGYDPEFWTALAQMDLIGLTLPAEHGGSGMGALDNAIIFEELGRMLVPSPLFVSSIVCGGLLADAGTAEQQSAWLPEMATGKKILSFAWHEPFRGDGPEGVQLVAKDDGDTVRLSGTKLMVPFASSADALLVLARSGTGPTDIDLLIVPTDAPGVELTHTFTTSSDASYEVTFNDVEVSASNRIGATGAGWDTFLGAMDRALVAEAARCVGGAKRTNEMSVSYAKERVQFGVPIGSFQGVAHPIANIHTEIQGAEVLVWEAAWSLDTNGTAGPLAAMAKRFAAETWRRATRTAHQTWGGVGFTLAIDVQLYFRRAKQATLTWFEPATLDERIAAAELDAETPFITLAAGAR